MPTRLLSSSDWQNLKRYLGSLFVLLTFALIFLLSHQHFPCPCLTAFITLWYLPLCECACRSVCVCAHMHSYTLQCYFAVCWFCLTLNLHEVMISLVKPLEVSLCYKQPASLWTGFMTPSSVICCLSNVGSSSTKPMLRKRSVTVKENSEFGQYLALP